MHCRQKACLQCCSEAAGMQSRSFFSRAKGRNKTKQQALHNGRHCTPLHIHIHITSACCVHMREAQLQVSVVLWSICAVGGR